MPPSLNSAYRNILDPTAGKTLGRAKSRAYKNWLADADEALYRQPRRKIGGPVRLQIRLPRRLRRGDASNRIKCVEDWLVSRNLIDDDRHVEFVSAEWSDVEQCEVEVRVYGE